MADRLTVSAHPRALAGIEGRLPPEIAEKAEADGAAKAQQDSITLLSLGILGGAFIAFGAIFSTVALTGAEGVLPFGVARVVAGLVFALGLSLVLIGGAQIFTGDVLMVMAWASGRLKALRVLRVWTLVWIGNLVGSLGVALLALLAGHHLFGGGQVGLTALRIAEAKAALPFGARRGTRHALQHFGMPGHLAIAVQPPAGPPRDPDGVADRSVRRSRLRTCCSEYVLSRLWADGEGRGA